MKRPTDKDVSLIPPGSYCYHFIHNPAMDGRKNCLTCPYLEFISDKPEQMNGYCHFLEKGDWEEAGTGLLWDMVKECSERRVEKYDYYADGHDPVLLAFLEATIEWGEKVIPLIEEEEYKQDALIWLNKVREELQKETD